MNKNTYHFRIAVNCANFSSGDINGVKDCEQIYDDYGMIALPDSYCETGKKTRLVISCHGSRPRFLRYDRHYG